MNKALFDCKLHVSGHHNRILAVFFKNETRVQYNHLSPNISPHLENCYKGIHARDIYWDWLQELVILKVKN